MHSAEVSAVFVWRRVVWVVAARSEIPVGTDGFSGHCEACSRTVPAIGSAVDSSQDLPKISPGHVVLAPEFILYGDVLPEGEHLGPEIDNVVFRDVISEGIKDL
jgi:hypothetical protein